MTIIIQIQVAMKCTLLHIQMILLSRLVLLRFVVMEPIHSLSIVQAHALTMVALQSGYDNLSSKFLPLMTEIIMELFEKI
jgi:hypothetical protein